MTNGLHLKWPGDQFDVDVADVHIEIEEHLRQIVLIGRSGVGKSTLLFVLAGLKRAAKGSITWQFPDKPNVSFTKHAKKSGGEISKGYAFQDGRLLPFLSAAENLAMPLILKGVPNSDALLRARRHLAYFLDLDVNDGRLTTFYPMQLSGGQRQRASLAKATISNPSIMFADEPTGGLDPETRVEIISKINEWLTVEDQGHKRLAVWITHNVDDIDLWKSAIINVEARAWTADGRPKSLELKRRYTPVISEGT